MKRRAFTMVEMLLATLLLGILTTFAVLTFNTVTTAWQVSGEYMDKNQRADYALRQVIAGLRSMYYPHDGKQDERYGFILQNNGDGEDAKDSDVIEWSKTGPALIGSENAVGDTVHRVQVLILEEGNTDYREPISVTGLYARQCPDAALRPQDSDTDYTFANEDMYQPVLIADGVAGFNCRVLKNKEKVEAKNDESLFEDEWAESNSVPNKVELTFRILDPEGKSYRTHTAPLMRIVRIPVFEQSQDGAETPTSSSREKAAAAGAARGGGRRGGGGGGQGGRGASPPAGGGAR